MGGVRWWVFIEIWVETEIRFGGFVDMARRFVGVFSVRAFAGLGASGGLGVRGYSLIALRYTAAEVLGGWAS